MQAVRKGHWIVLDELNLAPTEVLEALNRQGARVWARRDGAGVAAALPSIWMQHAPVLWWLRSARTALLS